MHFIEMVATISRRPPQRRESSRIRIPLLAWIVFSTAVAHAQVTPAEKPAAPAPNSTAACLECHSDRDLSMRKSGAKVSLFVDEKTVPQSAHRSLDCVDCHEKFDGDSTPHRKPMIAVDC